MLIEESISDTQGDQTDKDKVLIKESAYGTGETKRITFLHFTHSKSTTAQADNATDIT